MEKDIGKRRSLKSFCGLSALKTRLKTILGDIITFVRNLKDVIILTCFSLSFFALLGVQLYMGVLTSKCIRVSPFNLSEIEKIKDTEEFIIHASNQSNQFFLPGRDEPMLCRENADLCPENFVCLRGFGSSTNYGYTNFDSFGWALLSSFRLITRDFWEDVYQQIIITAGPLHIILFIVIILLGSYLLSLNLAIVAKFYYELHKKKDRKEREAETSDAAAMELAEKRVIVEEDVEGDDAKDKHRNNLLGEHEDKNEKLSIKDREKEMEKTKSKGWCSTQCSKCTDFCCIWDCCTCWIYFQKFCSVIAFDPFMKLFMTLCVIANTIFMAMDHHDMEVDFERLLYNGNNFFITAYILEAFLKIIALSPKFYFQDGWNRFDFFIAASCLIEIILEGVQGLSVLRFLRLLRIFKLAKVWPTFNLILSLIGWTLRPLKKLIILFGTCLLIFTVLGKNLFGEEYIKFKHFFYGGEVPRWNFIDYMHSFMTIFRILGSEWIETLWDCILVSGWTCIPFFLVAVIILNFVVVNLLLAVLLSSFGYSVSYPVIPGEEAKGIAEAFNRIYRAMNFVLNRFKGNRPHVQNEMSNQTMEDGDIDDSEMFSSLMVDNKVPSKYNKSQKDNIELKNACDDPMTSTNTNHQIEGNVGSHKLETARADIIIEEDLANCCPDVCYRKIPFCSEDYIPIFWSNWRKLRSMACKLIVNKYFEIIIMTMIIISSLALAAEDVDLKYRPMLESILTNLDKVLTILFLLEMLIKWLALGLKKYFTNAWCLIDFGILLISITNLLALEFGARNMPVFKTVATLRALLPLRALSRCKRMRVVLNVLAQALPTLWNVTLVSMLLWLVFAIMGVQLFGGKFYYCTDGEAMINISYVDDRMDCLVRNLTWTNPMINFDNVLNACLALFEVATFKGWIDIIYHAVDSRLIDEQPLQEAHLAMYYYFVCFAIMGSFLLMNLIIAVFINTFNNYEMTMRRRFLEMFMTEDQKNYYNAMKEKQIKKSIKASPRPTFKLQGMVFDLTTNKIFDMAIMVVIGLNTIVIAMDHYQMDKAFEAILDGLNMFFVSVLTVECVLKIFALRKNYFKDPWNIFDFVVVILSILGVILKDLIEKNFLSSSLLPFVGVIKVARVLRLVKWMTGVRTLLYSLAMLLPALFNICLLLFLVMFIYAIFGMSLFMTVKHRYAIDENFNFETFGQSMILLFQMNTGAGWDGVLHSLMEEDDCDPPDPEIDDPGNCGNKGIAIAYLVSYMTISFVIIVSLYIAVIFANYSEENSEEELTDDDYDMYYETWNRFDPDETQFIRYEQLSDFLDALKEPLRIPKPNKYKISSMDITTSKDNLILSTDILDALTKNFFRKMGHSESAKIYAPRNACGGFGAASSTLGLQREEYNAGIIQQGWRRYKGRGGRGYGSRHQQQTTDVVESDGQVIKN